MLASLSLLFLSEHLIPKQYYRANSSALISSVGLSIAAILNNGDPNWQISLEIQNNTNIWNSSDKSKSIFSVVFRNNHHICLQLQGRPQRAQI